MGSVPEVRASAAVFLGLVVALSLTPNVKPLCDVVYSPGSPQGGSLGANAYAPPCTLAAARQMLREAYDAFKAGEYSKARDLALRVYEELGALGAQWPRAGAWVPPPEIDLNQDFDTLGRQLAEAHRRAMLAAPGPGGVGPLSFDGTNARYLLWRAYVRLGEFEKAAPLLEQQLWYLPPEIREPVVRDLREKGVLRPYPHRADGPSIAEVPGTKWTRARWGAAVIPASVYWDDTRREAILSREGRFLVVRPGEATATLDGQPFQLEGVPYIENDRLILPLSALTSAFGVTLTKAQIEQITYRLGD